MLFLCKQQILFFLKLILPKNAKQQGFSFFKIFQSLTLVFLKYIDKKVKFTAFKENLRIALSKPTALLVVK